MTKTPKTCPTTMSGAINRLNTTRLMIQAWHNSIPIKIDMAFFLARDTYKPIQKALRQAGSD